MYDSATWYVLEQALADLQNGYGTRILQLNDDDYRRNPDGTYPNLLEAFIAITCLDDLGETSVAAVDANAHLYIEAAPRLCPSSARGYTCALWPVRGHARIHITGNGAGPIVVVGTTDDPATPLAGSRQTAEALEEGHLITVVANQHTGYNANQCVNDAVEEYLVMLTVPEEGLRCK